MLAEPKLVDKSAEQTYMGIRTKVAMSEIASVVPPLFPEVRRWLEAKGAVIAGPPFLRDYVIDMTGVLDVEVGWPVAGHLLGDGRVEPGTIPAGRYAEALHVGGYDKLMDATSQLLAWAEKNNIRWDMTDTGNEEHWVGRFEIYLTDPAAEPDPEKWETLLAFLTKA
jgi:effector-binding domain-containing protein